MIRTPDLIINDRERVELSFKTRWSIYFALLAFISSYYSDQIFKA